MDAKWATLCRANDMTVNEKYVDVQFANQRHHRVQIEEMGDTYRLSSIVVKQSNQVDVPDGFIRIMLQNRESLLVGYRIDSRFRIIAETWIPNEGITADEFQEYIRTIAEESDRFEYILTGGDKE